MRSFKTFRTSFRFLFKSLFVSSVLFVYIIDVIQHLSLKLNIKRVGRLASPRPWEGSGEGSWGKIRGLRSNPRNHQINQTIVAIHQINPHRIYVWAYTLNLWLRSNPRNEDRARPTEYGPVRKVIWRGGFACTRFCHNICYSVETATSKATLPQPAASLRRILKRRGGYCWLRYRCLESLDLLRIARPGTVCLVSIRG